ncbi:MAG: tetratricopeptide repeat protein [Bacteroidia bacterium]|nr:tetratricopeptide repeat protein [Bacteroidia bacterium]
MTKRILILVALVSLLSFSSFKSQSQTLTDAIRLMQSEQFDAAKKAYKSVISKEPRNGDAYFYFGQCYLYSFIVDSLSYSLDEVADSAYFYYKKGTESDPLNPLNYTGLGKVELLKKNAANAKASFDKAISLLPSKTNKNSEISKEKQALTYAKIAEAYAQVTPSQMKEAYAYLQSAQSYSIQDPAIYIITGDIYLEDGDATNAILNYKKAQDLLPNSPLAKIKIGNIYVRGRNLKAAIPYFEEAQVIDPKFAPVYREMGELYIKSGNNEKAKENFSKFLELSNKNIAARIKYIYALFLCKDYNNVLVQINEVFATDTSSTILNRLAGYSYFETTKYNEAKKSMDVFFYKTKPERIISSDFAYYGRIQSKLGSDSLAIESFKKAISKDTSNYDLLTETANILTKQKRNNEAIDLFNKKINSGKATSLDYYYLSKIYYGLFVNISSKPEYPKTDSLKVKAIEYLTKADTLCGSFIADQPSSMQGLQRRAQIKAALDPEFKGLAKPFYEKVLEKAQADSVKYTKELMDSYEYMGWYNYITTQNYAVSKMYYNRILAIDPKNAKAKKVLELPKLKNL